MTLFNLTLTATLVSFAVAASHELRFRADPTDIKQADYADNWAAAFVISTAVTIGLAIWG